MLQLYNFVCSKVDLKELIDEFELLKENERRQKYLATRFVDQRVTAVANNEYSRRSYNCQRINALPAQPKGRPHGLDMDANEIDRIDFRSAKGMADAAHSGSGPYGDHGAIDVSDFFSASKGDGQIASIVIMAAPQICDLITSSPPLAGPDWSIQQSQIYELEEVGGACNSSPTFWKTKHFCRISTLSSHLK